MTAGTPGGTRTPGPLLRRQLLYPPELQARIKREQGAGERSRTDFARTGSPQSCPSNFVREGGARKWSAGCPQGVPRGMDFAPTLERVMGIEPTRPAWKAGILPLNYTRMALPLTSANGYYHIFAGLSMVFLEMKGAEIKIL